MSGHQPIRISGHQAGVYATMIWVVRILLIMPVIWVLFIEIEVKSYVIAIAAIPWLLFETWRLIAWCRTLWLIDHGNGFTIKTLFRSDKYDDDDVLMTSLSFRYIQPHITSETLQHRTYRLWLRQRKITMNSLFRQSAPNDPLAQFITRIEERQRQKAKSTLDSGGEITGANLWSLTETVLTIKEHTLSEQIYPLSELVEAKCTVDRIAVWSRYDTTPVLSVPTSSPNALLLLQILSEKLVRQTPPSLEERLSDDSLGRQIFLSRRGQKFGVHLVIIALIVGFCFLRRANPDVIMVMVIGFLVFYVIFDLLPAIARSLSPGFDIYENGIVRRGLFGKTTIFFNKILGYTYTKNVLYLNSELSTSKIVLRIYWQDETGKNRRSPWRCRGRNLSHEFAEYDFFAGELSEIIVQRMWAELHVSGRVRWHDAIQIAANGVYFTATKGKAKKRGMVFVPFEQLRYRIEGTGTVFETNEMRAFVSRNELNYLPGLRFIHEVATAHSALS